MFIQFLLLHVQLNLYIYLYKQDLIINYLPTFFLFRLIITDNLGPPRSYLYSNSINGTDLYHGLRQFLLSEELLVINGFPRPHPTGEPGNNFYNEI